MLALINDNYMRRFFTIIFILTCFCSNAQETIFVGDILCSDNTVVSAEEFSSSGRTAIGIVFYVDNSNQHGWALALNDSGSGAMSWGDDESLCYLNSYNSSPQQVRYDTIGAVRCDSIVNTAQRIGIALDTYSSAVAAATENGDGWYLPSIGQMAILYGNMPEINTALDAVAGSSKMNGLQYWSCTEENAGVISAWALYYDGAIFATPKGTAANVRAIRNF